MILSCLGSNYQVDACVNKIFDAPISDDQIIAALKNIFTEQRFVTRNTAIALPRSVVLFKEIKIEQDLADEEMANFLQLNIAKYVGEPANNLKLDYKIIERSGKADRSILVHLVAARDEYITRYIQILRGANLCPTIIDVNVYALERAVRRQFKDISDLIAIINIDSDAMLLVVIDNKKIVYSHEDRGSVINMQTTAAIISWVKTQLQFVSSLSRHFVAKIILAGGHARAPGLERAVSEYFKIPTTIINPFVGMQFSPMVTPELIQQIAPKMLVSCGLALRV